MLSKWVKKHDEKMSAANTFPGKGKLAPYDKERFDLKKELATGKETFKKKPWPTKIE